jgi:hypothetical protein
MLKTQNNHGMKIVYFIHLLHIVTCQSNVLRISLKLEVEVFNICVFPCCNC